GGAAHQVRHVLAQLVQRVREVRREAALLVPHDEAVRETAAVHAVERAHAVRPALRELDAALAVDLVAGAARVVGAHLEAGGVDQAVDRVLAAAHHDAALADALDAPAAGVDQRDVGAIEGREVLVVEAGPFAELAVPRLQRLGGAAIRDDRVHTAAD